MTILTDTIPTNPVISVVMAAYNASSYIEEAMRSITVQSTECFEFIIVDDGSEDDTLQYMNRQARSDARIVVLSQPHTGLIAALNTGCRLAKGEYIARIDSDDVAAPDRLHLQLARMTTDKELALLGGAIECIDISGSSLFTVRWNVPSAQLRDSLLVDCHLAHTTVMFRTSVFAELGGYRAPFLHAEDYDLFLRISDKYSIDNLPHILCKYRLHDTQISHRFIEQQIISGIAARLSARARRSNKPEPQWTTPVTRSDLTQLGITDQRIDSLIYAYRLRSARQPGAGRWANSAFCELLGSDMNFTSSTIPGSKSMARPGSKANSKKEIIRNEN